MLLPEAEQHMFLPPLKSRFMTPKEKQALVYKAAYRTSPSPPKYSSELNQSLTRFYPYPRYGCLTLAIAWSNLAQKQVSFSVPERAINQPDHLKLGAIKNPLLFALWVVVVDPLTFMFSTFPPISSG